ncbi:MAG: plasmid encoded RepA protein [Bryobacterales bacterium]|nr:plasmid encoded RepA protein [Bryobacterales bacterium]
MRLPTSLDSPTPESRCGNRPAVPGGFIRGGEVLKQHFSDLVASKQKLRRADAIACVRLRRQEANQNLGFASRPFVLCGLPVKRPRSGQLLHERRNGHFLLQVTGHPSFGLPWGQDRLVPLFLATLAIRQQSRVIRFRSAAEMLDTFGMQQGGTQYRRLVTAFQRIFGATIFFGTDTQREKAMVVHRARFSFMSEARIWYSRNSDQETLPCEFQNEIVLSEEFFSEILAHPIPTDMEAAKALSCSPAALDLFTWLSYRCFVAKGRERVPLFGNAGLVSQLGSADYSRPRKFRERLDGWLDLVRALWPECPAKIDENGTGLWVDRASAVLTAGGTHVC